MPAFPTSVQPHVRMAVPILHRRRDLPPAEGVAASCSYARSEGGYEGGMTKLTPTQRAKLPAKKFGLPEKARTPEARKETGNYPMPDKGHAISAKRLARKNRKDGNLSKD